jgi:hypothetical protein
VTLAGRVTQHLATFESLASRERPRPADHRTAVRNTEHLHRYWRVNSILPTSQGFRCDFKGILFSTLRICRSEPFNYGLAPTLTPRQTPFPIGDSVSGNCSKYSWKRGIVL